MLDLSKGWSVQQLENILVVLVRGEVCWCGSSV